MNGRIFVWPDEDIDSLGKLREATDACGVPQREASVYDERAEAWGFGFRYQAGDTETANKGYRCLVKHAAACLYGRLATVPENKRWVWRVRPELTEDKLFRHEDSAGNAVDSVTYRSDENIREIDTGERLVKFYCRIWVEDDQPLQKPSPPPMQVLRRDGFGGIYL